jgi:hypothetical protein
LACPTVAGQNSHAGPLTGVIDSVRFESNQYYVFGWACQEGNRGSIDVHLYANHAAGDTPPGTFVTAGTANLGNEPAVDREGHDANGGKHRFKIALPNQLLRTFQQKKLYAHGIAIAGNVENAALAGSGNFQFPKPAWPPDPPPPNAFYNIDGKRIVALGHMEFHGWEHHMCALKTDTISCWYNVDTFNISEDAAIISRAPNRRRITSSAFLTNIRWIGA